MTQRSMRKYEIGLMEECMADAEKIVGTQSPYAASCLATSFFKFRRETNNKL